MNILVPDKTLRKFLKTKATPKEIKDYVSLAGPSIESIAMVHGEAVYHVEITTNRPDVMSVVGFAREAAAILPRFGIDALMHGDPYTIDTKSLFEHHRAEGAKELAITTDHALNPRFTAIVIDKVNITDSPAWLTNFLRAAGSRPINNVVDVTNYIMKVYGQPVHAFDYGEIKPNENGVPAMILRASKTGETITTLDGALHKLYGNDIIIEDGSGRLIDLCGLMGGENSHISHKTSSIVLFLQAYSPTHIRRTAMQLSHHTEAAALFEKSIDPELVAPCMGIALEMMLKLTDGRQASKLYDLYPTPFKPYTVSVAAEKMETYLGKKLDDSEINTILTALHLAPRIKDANITVTVPSFRRDIEIDVDIIEEVARMYGYHALPARIPSGEPATESNWSLVWIDAIKDALKYWGFIEVYTPSLVSKKLFKTYDFSTDNLIKLKNPLTEDGIYLRNSIIPGLLSAMKENQERSEQLKLFELANVYQPRTSRTPPNNPITESRMLTAAVRNTTFLAMKGVVERLFEVLNIANCQFKAGAGETAAIIEVDGKPCGKIVRRQDILLLDLMIDTIIAHATDKKTYQPIPHYPPIIEDVSFVFPPKTSIGPVIESIKRVDKLIVHAKLIDSYEQTSTFRIHYQDPKKSLTDNEVKIIHGRMIKQITASFKANAK